MTNIITLWQVLLITTDQEEDQRGGPGERFVEKDCQACVLNNDDAMDHSRWRNMIKDV